MASLRCSACGISWPNLSGKFSKCPVCLERTWYSSAEPAMADSEALSRKAHLDFDRFYEQEWPRIRAEQTAAEFDRIMDGVQPEPVHSD